MLTNSIEPSYIALYHSGELVRRVERLEARLASCDICPRNCGVNRLEGFGPKTQPEGKAGVCHSGRLPIVASVCAHHGEEPVLSGSRGSGTIFFGNCNLRCVYCQNHQISQDHQAQRFNEIDTRTLAERMLYLQDVLKCHNINLVTPSHFVPQIVQAVLEAVPMGLRIPLVYNTSSYDSLDCLKELDGIIDIYLPDLRYASDQWGKKFSHVPDYVERSRAAIKEMYRQVGDLALDDEGVARRGMIVRHLILPNGLAGSEESLTWLAREVSLTVTLSIMSQYYPTHLAPRIPLLSRKITYKEYAGVTGLLGKLGLENGWMQEMDSPENYLPDFSREEDPFSTLLRQGYEGQASSGRAEL
ncbi:MAG: radical SAM protein [Chloroflexi bacterium]|nr:radical SAM protein [Chloroflexota bacterium]